MAKDFKLKYLGLPAQLTDKLAYNNIVTAQVNFFSAFI